MSNYKWWKWPKTTNPNYNPWYVIAWKGVFLVPIYLLLWLVCLLLLCGWGVSKAKRFYHDELKLS